VAFQAYQTTAYVSSLLCRLVSVCLVPFEPQTPVGVLGDYQAGFMVEKVI